MFRKRRPIPNPKTAPADSRVRPLGHEALPPAPRKASKFQAAKAVKISNPAADR